MSFMNAASELTLKDRFYRDAVQHYVWGAYIQDAAQGDITTHLFLEKHREKKEADLTLGQAGIFAGLQEAEWFLKRLGIEISYAKKEGAFLAAGEVVIKLFGAADRILEAERTLLNLLQRMSGIASKTAEMRKKLPREIALLATRKTLWGALDKRAVFLGGGETHRLHLGDAILIKDNHLQASTDFKKDLSRVFRKARKLRFIAIELESEKAVHDFLEVYRDIHPESPEIKVAAMLDNLSPPTVGKLAPLLKKEGFFVEVSGGVTEKNIAHFALPGVSGISSGALTGKADTLDISLHFR